MQLSKSRLLHDTIRRYLRHSAWQKLDKLIAKTRIMRSALGAGG